MAAALGAGPVTEASEHDCRYRRSTAVAAASLAGIVIVIPPGERR